MHVEMRHFGGKTGTYVAFSQHFQHILTLTLPQQSPQIAIKPIASTTTSHADSYPAVPVPYPTFVFEISGKMYFLPHFGTLPKSFTLHFQTFLSGAAFRSRAALSQMLACSIRMLSRDVWYFRVSIRLGAAFWGIDAASKSRAALGSKWSVVV